MGKTSLVHNLIYIQFMFFTHGPDLSCYECSFVPGGSPWRLDPPETNCGERRPRAASETRQLDGRNHARCCNSNRKVNAMKVFKITYEETYCRYILGLWIKTGFDAFLLLKLTDGGGRSSVHLHLRYKCLIRSSWWYGFNRTLKWIHLLLCHCDKCNTACQTWKLPSPISLAFGCVGLDSWLEEDEYGTWSQEFTRNTFTGMRLK